MLFAHVICYTHLLALLTDNRGGGGGGGEEGGQTMDQNGNAPTLNYIVGPNISGRHVWMTCCELKP